MRVRLEIDFRKLRAFPVHYERFPGGWRIGVLGCFVRVDSVSRRRGSSDCIAFQCEPGDVPVRVRGAGQLRLSPEQRSQLAEALRSLSTYACAQRPPVEAPGPCPGPVGGHWKSVSLEEFWQALAAHQGDPPGVVRTRAGSREEVGDLKQVGILQYITNGGELVGEVWSVPKGPFRWYLAQDGPISEWYG